MNSTTPPHWLKIKSVALVRIRPDEGAGPVPRVARRRRRSTRSVGDRRRRGEARRRGTRARQDREPGEIQTKGPGCTALCAGGGEVDPADPSVRPHPASAPFTDPGAPAW
ncbi:hypothetical protein E3E14_25790 [Streptomyces sp. ICN441]|nr:hypothetical protein E3E14_25790 [Streptomyces sp. ICN441]